MQALEGLDLVPSGVVNAQRDGRLRFLAQKVGDDRALGRVGAAVEISVLDAVLGRLLLDVGGHHAERAHILLAVAAVEQALEDLG